MPWILDELGRSDKPDWAFTDRQSLPRNLSMPHVVPDASSWPVRIVQTSKRPVPDYTGGPALGIVVVSEAFKSLVESWDPVPHHFIPLEITRPDGTVAKGTNHIFKLGSFVENGIVTEKS